VALQFDIELKLVAFAKLDGPAVFLKPLVPLHDFDKGLPVFLA
jgi:hypothetical protein